jgi:tight adherence protein B
MKARRAVLVSALAPLLVAPQAFRVSVDAVEVDVFVGRRNQAILGLSADDFLLYDNDELQTIERLEATGLPVNVVLALDTSHSVRGEKLDHLKSAARDLLGSLSPEDGAAVVTFSSVVEATTAFDPPLDPLFAAIDQAESFGSTSLNDGVFAALKLAEEVKHPLLVVFTDGDDRFSWLDGDAVLETARKSEAPIFSVMERGARRSFSSSRVFLRRLADLSGGKLYESSAADMGDAFRKILAEAKTRYVLTFFPKDPKPGWHDLRIELRGRGAEVRARRGYYYFER